MPARIEPGMKRTSVSSRTTKESQLPEQPLRSQSHSVIHSSSEARLRLVTESVIEVATGVGVEVGAVRVLSPPQLHKNSENNRALNATVFFMLSFCPAPLRPATRDAQNLG